MYTERMAYERPAVEVIGLAMQGVLAESNSNMVVGNPFTGGQEEIW